MPQRIIMIVCNAHDESHGPAVYEGTFTDAETSCAIDHLKPACRLEGAQLIHAANRLYCMFHALPAVESSLPTRKVQL